MKRVLSPYFGQHLSASLNAADPTQNARHIGSSQTEDTVKVSPYFKGANIETLDMQRNEAKDKTANDEEENGKKTKSAKGQRRKAPIKVNINQEDFSFGIKNVKFVVQICITWPE